VNLDLGASLLTGLSTVDPADMAVARFFVYGLFGSDYDNSPYTQAGERVSRLAMAGIRLVIDEFRIDVTKTRKDGSRGKLRIGYGDSHEPEAPVKWLWKFIVCRAGGCAEWCRRPRSGAAMAISARHNHSASRKASSWSGVGSAWAACWWGRCVRARFP
jgi:hypothetical protein